LFNPSVPPPEGATTELNFANMKSLVFAFLITASLTFSASAQKQPDASQYKTKLGLKAGYNLSMLAGAKTVNFNPEHSSGFMFAGFFSMGGGTGWGYRTELVFSRQGYSYDSMNNKINVRQDYIYLPQLTTINIGKVFSLQLGGQIGFLINAKKTKDSIGGTKETNIMDYYNKLDYGLAGGFEIYPFKGLILGSRINYSLGPLYKQQEQQASQPPFPLPFNPNDVKGKNAVINVFLGYRF